MSCELIFALVKDFDNCVKNSLQILKDNEVNSNEVFASF